MSFKALKIQPDMEETKVAAQSWIGYPCNRKTRIPTIINALLVEFGGKKKKRKNRPYKKAVNASPGRWCLCGFSWCQHQTDEWKVTIHLPLIVTPSNNNLQHARTSLTAGIGRLVQCFVNGIRSNHCILLLEKSVCCGCTHIIWHLMNKFTVSVSCHGPDFSSIHPPRSATFWLQKLFPNFWTGYSCLNFIL